MLEKKKYKKENRKEGQKSETTDVQRLAYRRAGQHSTDLSQPAVLVPWTDGAAPLVSPDFDHREFFPLENRIIRNNCPRRRRLHLWQTHVSSRPSVPASGTGARCRAVHTVARHVGPVLAREGRIRKKEKKGTRRTYGELWLALPVLAFSVCHKTIAHSPCICLLFTSYLLYFFLHKAPALRPSFYFRALLCTLWMAADGWMQAPWPWPNKAIKSTPLLVAWSTIHSSLAVVS